MSDPSSSTMKRPRASSRDSSTNLQHDDYTVAWISALPLEMTAAEAMLDASHDPLPRHRRDGNCYTLGSINGHNVVMACLPKDQYGTNNAATVVTHLIRSFPNIQHCLMVGIGGGAPGSVDVRLGDVVVSTKVLQYDLGKALPNQFQRSACPISPSSSLLTVVSKLKASQGGYTNHFLTILRDSAAKLRHYVHPNLPDRLFQSDYNHPETSGSCDDCDQTKLVHRDARLNLDPVIHFGQIASGNQVIKDAHTRDSLSKDLKCICFEMEAAGIIGSSPCLAICGICDYSDSHKNKKWQEYAALTAAAYAKDLLLAMAPQLPTSSKRRKTQESETLDTEAGRCLKALFVTDPAQDREDILDAKGKICPGTCEWVLTTEEFKTWEQNPPYLLWISAPPGVGKTFLSIYLSTHFEAVSDKQSDAKAIYFFCDNKNDTRNTAVNILRGLIYRMIILESELIEVIRPVWNQRSSQLFESKSFGVLWKVFEEMIENSKFRTVYCVIDALDECEPGSLRQLLTKFEQLSDPDNTSPKKVRLVCLSRRFPERIPESLDLFTKIELDMMPAGKADVERFIAERVSTLARKKRMTGRLKARVEEAFQRKSEGTFLWVSFMAQDLEQKRLQEIEMSLNGLPAGLDAIYDRILSQIDRSNWDTVKRMLEWILVATRPLRVPELCDAAGVTPTEFLTRGEVCRELIKSCGHLLQITEGEPLFVGGQDSWADEKRPWRSAHEVKTLSNMFWSLSVTFLHQSAKDYYIRTIDPERNEGDSALLARLHGSVADQLTRSFCHISCAPPKETYYLTADRPLALYMTTSWHLHLGEADDIGEVIKQNSSFFCEASQSRMTYGMLMQEDNSRFQFYDSFDDSVAPLLHLASFLNVENLVKWCLDDEQQTDINELWGDERHTPLQVAIAAGNQNIINILLDANADVLVKDNSDENALFHAVRTGRIDIFHRISQQNECKRWIAQEARNPQSGIMQEAIRVRNEEACRCLVEEFKWDVNLPRDNEPIYAAIRMGHFELAQLFASEWHARFDNFKVLEAICQCSSSFVDKLKSLLLVFPNVVIDINAKN
ncbi:hypothetical protein NW752_010293 [Fusarium irregulare]|uniref:Uncharacterized protein n=1 Tax=Fusarium irregulare TaxID=2494466 RepID=A0A9W8PIR5_9HYPO|nr:hypothetical protein NW752_010293 [Fusarium irregulare]KAJ4007931.1 hypothetical protein NW766_009743 [Fusarium irregulare]